jgi:hypothetical protein
MKFRSISQALKQKVGVIHELLLLFTYRLYPVAFLRSTRIQSNLGNAEYDH